MGTTLKKNIFVLSAVALMFLAPLSASAVGAIQYFGGRQVLYLGEEICNCPDSPPTNIHVIQDVKLGLIFLYYPPGVRIFSNYNIFGILNQQTGSYEFGGPPCMTYVGEGCIPLMEATGTYIPAPGVGTSLISMSNTTHAFLSNKVAPFIKNLFTQHDNA